MRFTITYLDQEPDNKKDATCTYILVQSHFHSVCADFDTIILHPPIIILLLKYIVTLG